jgi:hypothetical protein
MEFWLACCGSRAGSHKANREHRVTVRARLTPTVRLPTQPDSAALTLAPITRQSATLHISDFAFNFVAFRSGQSRENRLRTRRKSSKSAGKTAVYTPSGPKLYHEILRPARQSVERCSLPSAQATLPCKSTTNEKVDAKKTPVLTSTPQPDTGRQAYGGTRRRRFWHRAS